MTRKHFEAMAEMVRGLTLSPADKEQVISTMIRTFSSLNPRFNAQRFRDACEA